MSWTCPNGHQSDADDYCDVCGSPIDASAQTGPGQAGSGQPSSGQPSSAQPSAAPAGSGARSSLDLDPMPTPGVVVEPQPPAQPEGKAELLCPNCGAVNPSGALFCEACGYDFTTGAMPRVAEPAGSAHSTEADSAGSARSTEAAAAASSAHSASPSSRSSSPETPPTSPSNAQSAVPSAADGTAFEWLAEVWVDPDWYQTQEAEDPCPSPGLPVIVPLRARSVLMGRVSQSRNTHPEIDLSSDPGVSRRHAQLTTDGVRWFVEDLGSSNGTFVGPASGPLPDNPITVGPKTELGDDDRLYVGAWSRVVVRRATPDEVETYA